MFQHLQKTTLYGLFFLEIELLFVLASELQEFYDLIQLYLLIRLLVKP